MQIYNQLLNDTCIIFFISQTLVSYIIVNTLHTIAANSYILFLKTYYILFFDYTTSNFTTQISTLVHDHIYYGGIVAFTGFTIRQFDKMFNIAYLLLLL